METSTASPISRIENEKGRVQTSELAKSTKEVSKFDACCAFNLMVEKHHNEFALLSAIRDRVPPNDLVTYRLIDILWYQMGDIPGLYALGRYFDVDINEKAEA
ncbi:MAG: hypothetical protein Q4G39_03370 [Brachymonas sp.]|nr:hypothetical protein [Brachymonas sp.]